MTITRTYFTQTIKLNPNNIKSLYNYFLIKFITNKIINNIAYFTSKKLIIFYKKLYNQHPFLHNKFNINTK